MDAELIDHMGSDLTVVNAARVSFNKESAWEPEAYAHDGLPFPYGSLQPIGQTLSDKDQKLIKYLAKHNHWTPFSHVQITMRETVPIFVARQRFKHVVGFTYNEISRRYVDDTPSFYIPEVWRKRSDVAKQGSSDEIVEGRDERVLDEEYSLFIHQAQELYGYMLEIGVAPEQARMVLPQSLYTSYYVTGSLPAWSRAYKLRADAHAQKEIQDLASRWNEIISGIQELKYSWQALVS